MPFLQIDMVHIAPARNRSREEDGLCVLLQADVGVSGWLQLQLEKLTASFQCVTEDLRRQFMVDGEPLLHENSIGSSPILASSFRRTTGFNIPDRNQLSSSGLNTLKSLHCM